jgi:O-antigen ligase
MGDRSPAYASTVSVKTTMARARRLRAASRVLEALVWLIVAGSVAAIGSVHPWAYVPLWVACLVTALVLVVRTVTAASLKRALGSHLVAFHLSGRWLVLDPVPEYENQGWTFDLRRPLLRSAPLFWPGLAFLLWVGVQLVPLIPGGGTLTSSVLDTRRGLAFVASFLILHLAAAAVFEEREARRRFRRFVALLGLALAAVALLQAAVGAQRIYGFFQPLEHGAIFGPFVNRNHFAGYMLMVVFVAFGVLARAWRRYHRRVGERPNLRRTMITLSTPEGVALVYAAVPALAAVAALIATTSRGALLAFAVGLVLAGLGLRRGGGVPAWALAVAFVMMTVSWFGLERLSVRFNETSSDAPGRTAVWRDSLGRMKGRWLTGTGFNTFGPSMSHTPPLALPKGATPWPEAIESAARDGDRPGIRALIEFPGLGWYREAHNDYVQTLVETGVPGLFVALWAAVAALGAVRRDPWLLAAVAAVLMHAFVDFDLQIPAIPVLLVCLIAMRPEAPPS